MKTAISFLAVILIVLGAATYVDSKSDKGHRLLIYIDRSSSIPEELFRQALQAVADALWCNIVELGITEISVRCFDDNVSLVMLQEKTFILPDFPKDSILSQIKKQYGIVGYAAKTEYDAAIINHGQHLKSIVSDAALYIRKIQARYAVMTDIAGLLEHFGELDAADLVIAVTDLKDENPDGKLREMAVQCSAQTRVVILYVPSKSDLHDPRGVRAIMKERKGAAEKAYPRCLVVPLRCVSKSWKELFRLGTGVDIELQKDAQEVSIEAGQTILR